MHFYKNLSFFLLVFNVVAGSSAWPQEVTESQNIFIQQTMPLKIELINEPPDARGTDVRNIYTFNVDFDGPKHASDMPFLILVHVDNVAVKEFKNQKLPLSFKWNLKGLTAGEHTVRFVLEDNKGNKFASQSVTVDVVR